MDKNNVTKLTPIILLFAVILFFIGQYFLYTDIKKTNQNWSVLSYELETKNNIEEYMISTGKIIQNLSNDLGKINKSIVSSTGDVEFIESIEKLADSNNLSIVINSLQLETNSKSTTSPVAILRINFKTEGGWLGTYKFLNQIESMPVKVKVNSYTFQSQNTDVISEVPVSTLNAKWESRVDLSVLKYR